MWQHPHTSREYVPVFRHISTTQSSKLVKPSPEQFLHWFHCIYTSFHSLLGKTFFTQCFATKWWTAVLIFSVPSKPELIKPRTEEAVLQSLTKSFFFLALTTKNRKQHRIVCSWKLARALCKGITAIKLAAESRCQSETVADRLQVRSQLI